MVKAEHLETSKPEADDEGVSVKSVRALRIPFRQNRGHAGLAVNAALGSIR